MSGTGEHLRVFPLSNFTERDVWDYIAAEKLELPSLYFSHDREIFDRDGMLYAASPISPLLPNERIRSERVRFRTVGDLTCTGSIKSDALTVEDILHELTLTDLTERGATRADDRVGETSMEDRKREGYF